MSPSCECETHTPPRVIPGRSCIEVSFAPVLAAVRRPIPGPGILSPYMTDRVAAKYLILFLIAFPLITCVCLSLIDNSMSLPDRCETWLETLCMTNSELWLEFCLTAIRNFGWNGVGPFVNLSSLLVY